MSRSRNGGMVPSSPESGLWALGLPVPGVTIPVPSQKWPCLVTLWEQVLCSSLNCLPPSPGSMHNTDGGAQAGPCWADPGQTLAGCD